MSWIDDQWETFWSRLFCTFCGKEATRELRGYFNLPIETPIQTPHFDLKGTEIATSACRACTPALRKQHKSPPTFKYCMFCRFSINCDTFLQSAEVRIHLEGQRRQRWRDWRSCDKCTEKLKHIRHAHSKRKSAETRRARRTNNMCNVHA